MKVTHDNINTFLYTPGKYFIIPDFQRPYSWDKANIASFLEDVESVMSGNKNHYFGSIVFISEGNNSTIIDGQQRATTVLLMLTALFHIIKDNPTLSIMPAEQIKDRYLYNEKDYTEEKNRIKLKTITTDNKIFEEIFDRKNYSDNSKDSKLYQAYAYFYEYFQGKNNLEKYIDALENFEIVAIALEASDDNPQRIFESINSTGKPLTDGDKIRNFALMLNNKEARKIVFYQYWDKIEKQLTDINKDYISDFFKYYLTSQLQKEVKIEQVYPEFKKLFIVNMGDGQEDISKLEKFYGRINDYLNHYIFLKFNRDESNFYNVILDKGCRLNFLKIETPFPFLMRVLDEYKKRKIEEKELSEIFSVIENYLARRIICNMSTTGLNKFFSTLHKDIKNYTFKNPTQKYVEIFKFILNNRSGDLRVPKESEVESAVQNNPFYTQKNIYINFILSSIDDQSRESKLLRQMANGDMQLSIEHIMPQTLNKQWKEDLGEDYDMIHLQHVDTLPNLTLTAYNSKYSNNDFNTKKTIENGFEDSPLIINQFIKNFDKWDLSALKKREKWWLSQIKKIWPIPQSSFMPDLQETELTFAEDTDLTGSRIKGINIFGEVIECNSWIVAFEIILKKFFEIDSNLFDYVITDDYLHKYIKSSPDGLRGVCVLDGTPYFYEGNTNTNLKRNIVVKLADHLEIDKTDIRAILNIPE